MLQMKSKDQWRRAKINGDEQRLVMSKDQRRAKSLISKLVKSGEIVRALEERVRVEELNG